MRKEQLEEILAETKKKAESFGFETNFEDLDEVTDPLRAYYIGRVEALESLLMEIALNELETAESMLLNSEPDNETGH